MCIRNLASRSQRFQHGFTLVELIIFIVIVSIAVIGILQVMNVTTNHSADPQIHKQALSIAEALMEEVSLAPFTYCDATMTEDGSTCSVEDGRNVSSRLQINSGLFVPVNDINGNAVPALGNYTTRVSISDDTLGGIINDVLHITITVRHDAEDISLDGYRTRYMPGTLQ